MLLSVAEESGARLSLMKADSRATPETVNTCISGMMKSPLS